MPKTFFITTAIDYTNSAPHIGHAYEKILADVIARYRRLKGDNVFFLTGVDQHGQKVQQSAEREGVPPEQFVAGVTEQFIALWDKLDVRYDAWAATTDPLHKKCVQGMLQRLFDEGKIYKDKQVGFYSVRQEQFLTDKDRNEAGEFGPEWGEVEQREEENYYFELAEHKQWLLDFIDARSKASNPFVVPDFRVAELRNAVEKIGDDSQSGSDRQSGSGLCISRPKSRLSWGIELPFDSDYVNYVWFDALTNYINSIGNLLNRTLSMTSKYAASQLWATAIRLNEGSNQIPASESIHVMTSSGQPVSLPSDSKELGLRDLIENLPKIYVAAMDSFLVSLGLVLPEEISAHCNRLVEKTAPWKLAKNPEQTHRLHAIVYHLAESLRIIAILISPVLPKAAHGIFDQLNWKMELSGKEERFRLEDAKWGGLPDGHVVGKPVPLFPRIEG